MKSIYMRWKESWGRDGPDDSILEKATGPERDQLVEDLIANLDESEAIALAWLGATSAIPGIKRRMEHCQGAEKAAYACALIRLTGGFEFIPVIASVLDSPETTSELERVEAAHYLANCRHPQAFDALERAMHDPAYLVRYNAAVVFSRNSDDLTDEKTIVDQVADYDEERINEFARRLRSKIYRDGRE